MLWKSENINNVGFWQEIKAKTAKRTILFCRCEECERSAAGRSNPEK
jgi:ribosomal protein L44E